MAQLTTPDEKVKAKKFLTEDFIASQVDYDFMKDLLGQVDTSIDTVNPEREEYEEGEFVGDFISPDKKELSLAEVSYIHGIVDTELPDPAYTLTNKYIPEDVLAQQDKVVVQALNPSSNKIVEKEYTAHRTDIPSFIEIDNSTTRRIFTIDFEELLLVDGLKDKLMTKTNGKDPFSYNIEQKSYQGIIDKIVNDYNFIFNEYPEVAVKIFKFRSRLIQEGITYDTNNFFLDVVELVNDNQLRTIIKAMDDSTYVLSLDEISQNSTRKIVEDLRLTDKCNKVLLQSAIMCRLLVPIINEYCIDMVELLALDRNALKYMINHLSLATFSYVCRYFSIENDVNLMNKLYMIVEPRVKSTNYSDKVIWNLLESYSLDDDIAINKFMNKIIRTIIPKIDVNKSSISFLDVVIRHMINSDFHYNFVYSHKIIQVSSSDDDDVSDLDKVALTHHHKSNEMNDIILNASMQQFIKKQMKRHKITEAELDTVETHMPKLNEFQVALIKLYYNTKFPRLEGFSRRQLVSLIVILYKKLLAHNLTVLAHLLLGKRTDNEILKSTGRVSIDITKSRAYQEIRENFTYIINKFDKDGYLLKLSSVFNFKFTTLNLGNQEYELLPDLDRRKVASELFDYAYYCMSDI